MERKRAKGIYYLLAALMLIQTCVLFVRSGVIPGLSVRADKLKVFAESTLDDIRVIPGDIRDRNGKTIVKNDVRTRKTKDKTTKESFTKYYEAEAFSQLVGYTGPRKIRLNVESVEDIVGEREDYRLMRFLDDHDYWGNNGLYSTAGMKGQSAVLTVDSRLQAAVYEVLHMRIGDDQVGSAVILDAKTAEILAMVSLPAYDFNEKNKAIKKMMDDAENPNLEPQYPVTYKNAEVPGSIFKVLMSVAMIDHGMESFTADNVDFTLNGWECKAKSFNDATISVNPGDLLDLHSALITSSNVYFAKAALELGSDALKETAEKFGLGSSKKVQKLLLDCGTVPYSFNASVEDKELAQLGFGQGTTEITALQAAMIVQAIANDGKMMKPYVIKELIDEKGKTIYTGNAEELSEATNSETAKKVKELLHETALINAEYHDFTDVHKIFEKYQVAGKTGTGETAVESKDTKSVAILNNAWYVSFAPVDSPKYVVVVNQCKADKSGYEMMPIAAEIYRYLFEEY